jgi:hypothetical protein
MAIVYPIARIKNSVRDDSPVIAVGKNRYYLSQLFNKHLHAGQDVEVFTSFGDIKAIKQGEWIGNLFSYVVVLGKPALMFKPAGNYFGAKYYYMPYYGVHTLDEKLLTYNYTNSQWTRLSAAILSIVPIPFGIPLTSYYKFDTLPTKSESDKASDARDKKVEDLDNRDDWFKSIFGDIGSTLLWGGAALAGFKSLSSDKQMEQVAYGGVAAFLGYKAFNMQDKK